MSSAASELDQNILWLKAVRERFQWSTSDVAKKVFEVTDQAGEPVRLSQQSISGFENGALKSTPKWLVFVEIAAEERATELRMPTSNLPPLNVPRILVKFRETWRQRWERRNDFAEFLSDDEADRQKLAALERRDASAEGLAQRSSLVEIDMLDLSYGMGASFVDYEPGALDVEKAQFSDAWLRKFTQAPARLLFTAIGTGDSMMPTIHDQDLVIVDRSADYETSMGDKIWAIVFGGVGMIKRLRPMPDGTVKIMSDNLQVRDEVASDGDLFVVGRVVASVRRH